MKFLSFDWNNVLADVEEELVARGHERLPLDGKEDTWKEADVVIVWQETELGGWKDWIKDVQAAGKPVILVQHGRRGTSRIFPPFNEELVSDYVCVWGEADKRRMMECGVDEDKIYVTGTPVLKHIKPREEHKGWNVVFSPEHWDTEVPENAIVAGALRRIPRINVITKTLEGEHNPAHYDNPVPSNRREKGHLETCVEVLQKADCVVAISESTFELLAEAMDIPVVIADIWIPKACAGDDRYKEYQREYSEACERVKDIKDLEKRIKWYLKYPKQKQTERAAIVELDGGSHIEDPTGEIIKIIERACENSKV